MLRQDRLLLKYQTQAKQYLKVKYKVKSGLSCLGLTGFQFNRSWISVPMSVCLLYFVRFIRFSVLSGQKFRSLGKPDKPDFTVLPHLACGMLIAALRGQHSTSQMCIPCI